MPCLKYTISIVWALKITLFPEIVICKLIPGLVQPAPFKMGRSVVRHDISRLPGRAIPRHPELYGPGNLDIQYIIIEEEELTMSDNSSRGKIWLLMQ